MLRLACTLPESTAAHKCNLSVALAWRTLNFSKREQVTFVLFSQFYSFPSLQVAIYVLPGDFYLCHLPFVGGELNDHATVYACVHLLWYIVYFVLISDSLNHVCFFFLFLIVTLDVGYQEVLAQLSISGLFGFLLLFISWCLDAYVMTNLFSTFVLVGQWGYIFVKGVFASLPSQSL